MKRLLRFGGWFLGLNERATDWLVALLSALFRRFGLVALLALGGGVTWRLASATRSAGGTYSLFTPGNPIVTGTASDAPTMNSTLSDIAVALTDSKSRSGLGDFTAPVRGADGTSTAPTWSFTSETSAGLFRNGAADLRMTFNGTTGQKWTSTVSQFPNGAVGGPSISFLNDTGSGLYRAGSNDIRLAINGADVASFNSAVTTTNNIAQFFAPSLANGSTTRVWTGKSTSATAGGFMSFTPNATASLSTTCLDVAGQSSTLCVDGNGLTTVNNRINIGVGVSANGSGFKHQNVAGCTTTATAFNCCTSTLTWTTAFADTNYDVACSCLTSTDEPLGPHVNNLAAASVVIQACAPRNVAAGCGTFSCIAVHN